MDQGEARRLAKTLNEELPHNTVIALTRDHFRGEFETTNEWGVSMAGKFYGSVEALPGSVQAVIAEQEGWPIVGSHSSQERKAPGYGQEGK